MIVVAIVMVIVVMIMLLVVMVSLEARCDPEQSAPTLDPACHLAAPSHIAGAGVGGVGGEVGGIYFYLLTQGPLKKTP